MGLCPVKTLLINITLRCSFSVGRVWLCVPQGWGPVMKPDRSQAYCLVAKTRIIYLTFSYLHATMREDRMSKLFRKISPYSEKHLHLLRVSSSTSSQWAGPSTALAYVCVWQQSRVSVWEKEDAFASNNCTETKGNSAYRNLEHPDALSFALGLNRGFQFT